MEMEIALTSLNPLEIISEGFHEKLFNRFKLLWGSKKEGQVISTKWHSDLDSISPAKDVLLKSRVKDFLSLLITLNILAEMALIDDNIIKYSH